MQPRRLGRPSALRCAAAGWRERVVTALAFEIVGNCVVAPAYRSATGSALGDSFGLILAVSSVAALWCGTFNALFDWIYQRLCPRLPSRRPHRIRMLQSTLRELTEIPVTLPAIYALTGAGLEHAVCADIALAVVYIAYGYVFQLVVDWLSVNLARRRLQVTARGGSARAAAISA
jgi:uncharacterized membrane protein